MKKESTFYFSKKTGVDECMYETLLCSASNKERTIALLELEKKIKEIKKEVKKIKKI